MRRIAAGMACLGATLGLSAWVGAVAGGQTSPRANREASQTTLLVTRSLTGDLPNGPSRNAAISQDLRIGRVVAFESDASDLVPGDTNRLTDVFAILRKDGYGTNGTPWSPGTTLLVSRGRRDRPANGRSWGAAVDGEPPSAPSCVAFVSKASNLVRGDTNHKADAFVYYLATRRIKRVSVNSRGRQSNGSTFDVAVDGTCDRIAFTSNATNLALTRTSKSAWKPLVTNKPRRRVKQVYVRLLGDDDKLKGATFLASASNRRRAGNGSSSSPSFAIRFNSANHKLAFASKATNLVRKDRSRRSDIYVRDLRAGRFGGRRLTTRLASATPTGGPGNGASTDPSFSEQGYYVAYETLATNLLPGDTNGVSDVARADLRDSSHVVQGWASKDPTIGQIGNAASANPSTSTGGAYVAFDSSASNLGRREGGDRNGVRDVFLYTAVRNLVLPESLSSNRQWLTFPSTNPSISSRGNYLVFETADPLADLDFVAQRHPDWRTNQAAIRARAASEPRFHQIYMRYLGPK